MKAKWIVFGKKSCIFQKKSIYLQCFIRELLINHQNYNSHEKVFSRNVWYNGTCTNGLRCSSEFGLFKWRP